MRFLVPIIAAALSPWPVATTTSALGAPDVERTAAFRVDGGALASSYVKECEYALAAFVAGTPPPVQTVHGEVWDGPVAAGDGYAALLFNSRCGGKGLDLARLGVDGRVRSRVPLPLDDYPYPAALAAAPDGALAVAWVDNVERRRLQRLRVGVYGTNGWVRRPVTVATRRGVEPDDEWSGIAELAVDVNAAHRVVVAYADEKSVRTLKLGGRPGVIGPSLEEANLVARIADSGRTAVAYGTHDGGEEINLKIRVYASLDGSPARLLETQPRLDRHPFSDEPDGNPHLAIAPNGRVLLSWDSLIGARKQSRPLRVAIAPPGRDFGPIRTLTGNANPGTVAIADDGRALVTWTHRGTIYARLTTPAGHFRPRERIGRGGFPYASFDDRPRIRWLTSDELHVATRRR